MTTLIVLIILFIIVFGVSPRWGYSQNWGWGPSGIVGFILLILFILWLTGHLHISLPS